MSYKILLVDDEKDILDFLQYNLNKEGFKTYTASNGLEAIEIAENENPDLIVLDMMMPIMSGIDICKLLRSKKQFKKTLIVFLTAKSSDEAEIESFQIGADDYIRKPIRTKVFIQRIKSLFDRRFISKEKANFLSFKNLRIDVDKRVVYIKEKKVKNIPKKQFQILILLSSKPERFFSREEIYNKIWGIDIIVGDRTLDVHIRKLREKIGKKFIKTSKGVGYAFIPE